MARRHPVFGLGPGTFSAEYVGHRLAAEIRFRARFINDGTLNASYAEAHNEYLQMAAEAGLPAALATTIAWMLLVRGLLRRVKSGDVETRVLLGLLVAAAVSSLLWFPFQATSTGLYLLLAAGRAWRLVGAPPS
jgi:O-antigen ligase